MNKIVFIVTAIVGVILTVVGAIVLFAVLPKAIESKVADEMYIQNGTGEAYKRFVDLSVPLLFKINFFHIDDPNQFNGVNISSIKFRQRGPYIYTEKRHKVDIQMDPSGNTVSYLEEKHYEFNAEKSHAEGCMNCTQEDKIRIVHVGLGLEADNLSKLTAFVPSFTIEDTVNNIAFHGAEGLFSKAVFRCKDDTPECNPRRVVGTGKDNIDHLGILYEYAQNKGHTQFWSLSKFNTTGSCSAIRGTDATQFHPNVKEDQTLYAYEDMLCRSVKLVKGLTDQEHQGISTLRFYTDDSNFAASEDNQCFCYAEDHKDCDAGTLNLKHCPPANTPFPIEVVASQPFFMSNQALLEETGLAPLVKKEDLTQEKYGTILDVEPYTGLALYARKRVQISVLLKKGSHPLLANLAKSRMYGPILWIEEAGDVDKENADKLKDKIFGPKKTYTGLLIGVMALGVLLLAAAGGCAFFNRR